MSEAARAIERACTETVVRERSREEAGGAQLSFETCRMECCHVSARYLRSRLELVDVLHPLMQAALEVGTVGRVDQRRTFRVPSVHKDIDSFLMN